MLTVPLAICGALISLWIFGQTLNIFSQIGMIMLIGLVTKNGILIVEFANKKREEGLSKMEAVLEASRLRLRPILMTSLAMALGCLPIALSLGAASTSRKPLGIVIVGGVIFSLVLTLFVIPAMYTYLSRQRKHNPLDEAITVPLQNQNLRMKLRIIIALMASSVTFSAYSQKQVLVNEVIALALENGYDVRLSKNALEAVTTDNGFAVGGFLPQLNGAASTTERQQSTTGVSGCLTK